ncbi:MAG: ATP-dependent Clp protease ATP-binding subunit [Candidatus Kerfeldbacteria bacterium]|nr:ATP-dependent Clp protease ATP-binding subunit [Candidatus Kerfeldbacteria bacterium]
MDDLVSFFNVTSLLPMVVVTIIIGAFLYQRNRQQQRTDSHAGRSVLQQYSTNFTALAQQGKLDPVIGRQREVDQLIRVLSRKTKNNALLLGEPGVGKTAVVERLALLIEQGSVPETLQHKQVIALDLASLVAGTKYRGELEQRLDALRKEFQDSRSNVILFIDEIQELAQAKGTEGGLNPGDILKPELARGYLQVIGATTYDDYEKYILPEESLERRFQPIHIHEATREETLAILTGVKSVFEQFHHVQYPADVLTAIVDLSQKHVVKRYLPDKAIDVLDEAGVRTRIENLKQKNTTTSIQPAVSLDIVREVIADWIDKPIEQIN